MDFTTLLTDIWVYVKSYVPLMSPNEDETGLALLITSSESNSSSYIYIYIYTKVSTSYGASIENPICSMMLYFIKTVWGLENF